ncbi:beta-lactamase/transpeptidase-like protein [Lactifluus subvellereus]|nr:beta-lactamase/transpeptidase-like protein [Lactifluus subvellereus]
MTRISHYLVISVILHCGALVSALPASNQCFFDAFGPFKAILPPILTPEFTETVQQIVDTYQIPGLALAVVHKDGPPEYGTWGKNSEDGSLMTVDTSFNIGSCSKAFLAASLGILIEDFAQGRNTTPLPIGLSTLNWQTKLASILPGDWELSDPWASQKANLIDILSHVHDLTYKQNGSALDITRNLRNLRPSHELREKFLYNNQMYTVGAQVITALSGVHFTDFVKDRILKPLNMTQSTYSIDEAIQSGQASETWTSFGRRIPPWQKRVHAESLAGPGGLISNVKELTPWVKLFLNDGVDPDTNTTVIPPEALETVTSAHTIVDGNPRYRSESCSFIVYGLGWLRLSCIGHDILLHTGGAPGVSAVIAAFGSDGVGVVALANADLKQPTLVNITNSIARKLFGLDAQSPLPQGRQPHDAESQFQSAPEEEAGGTRALPRVDLAGTYHDAGYGTFELCSAASRSTRSRDRSESGANATTSNCQRVLDDFRHELPTNDHDGLLLVSWPSIFTSHARFAPAPTESDAAGRHRHVVDFVTLYPAGYGRNSTPFAHWLGRTIADFVVEDGEVKGFGLYGIGGREGCGSVEECSDVWFTKCG